MPQVAEYRGGFWLFLSEVALAVLGAAYWFILSRLVGATELGTAAAVISVGSLVTILTSLGVETGLLRHAGEMLKRGDKTSASTYLWSSVVIRIPMLAVAVFIVTQLPTPDPLYSATLAVVVSLVGILNIYTTAMYRTEVRFVVNVVSSLVRVVVGVMLAGWGWLGVVISYISGSIVSLVIFAGFVLRHVVFTKPRIGASIEVVKAGVPLWASSASILTVDLTGILSVYVATGAAETGVLYVAHVASWLVTAAASISVGLLVPALAAMDSGRREAAASACRSALALSA
ncbi:MAG: oligosaccharide flippase family protein, partial [Pyrobaculum sp.]